MAGGYGNKTLEQIYQQYQYNGVDTEDLQDQLKGLVIDGDMIVEGSLVVGENVTMGENATISWENVTDSPSIPNSTYIDENGIYTGEIRSEQIDVGELEGFVIRQSGNLGEITLDDKGLTVSNLNGNRFIEIAIDESADDSMGYISFYNTDEVSQDFYVGGIGSDNLGNLSLKGSHPDGFARIIGDTFQVYKLQTISGTSSTSLAEYKENIKEWEGSALDLIRNSTIYEYMLKGEERLRQGLVIGEGYNTPEGVVLDNGVEHYTMISWAWKAIQEIVELLESRK